MSDTPPDAPRAGLARWVKMLLIASLSGNLLIGGMFVGQYMRGNEKRPHWVYRIVPDTQREEARALFQSKRDEISGQIAEMSDIHRQIATLVGAEPFDQGGLEAAFAQRRAKAGEMSLTIHSQMVVIVSRMSPEERAEMARRMVKGTDRWARRRARILQ